MARSFPDQVSSWIRRRLRWPKRNANKQAKCLGPVALTPTVLLADRDADGGGADDAVDVPVVGHPDVAPVDELDGKDAILCGVEIGKSVGEPVFDRARRDGVEADVSRGGPVGDLRVVAPTDVVGRVRRHLGPQADPVTRQSIAGECLHAALYTHVPTPRPRISTYCSSVVGARQPGELTSDDRGKLEAVARAG